MLEFQEKPARPRPLPGTSDRALASMGIYVFDAALLCELLERDAADSASSHDFGKDVIPRLLARHRVMAHRFADSCVNMVGERPYWRDVGTVDAYWAANLDLASTTPELNMYDRSWPIWTYQEQLPPAKFVHADESSGRVGMAIESLVSGGCIISGASVRNSVLFSNVLVRSFAKVDRAVVLPEVQIERGCRLTKVVIDRGCKLPEGLVIGEDAQSDAQRFHRTPSGVVLVTPAMLDKLR